MDNGLRALEDLYRLYWFPIYAYARRLGYSQQDADELIQFLSADLLKPKWLGKAKPPLARFRTFLLAHLHGLISNRWQPPTARNRGEPLRHPSIDTTGAEERFQAMDREGQDPARVFDRAWAGQVVDQALDLLGAKYALHNTDVPFEALRGFLPGGSALERPSLEELEQRYPGVNRAAVLTRVRRLKKRLPEFLLAVISETVRDPAEAQDELRYLVEILAGG